jgi:hypothetical protein
MRIFAMVLLLLNVAVVGWLIWVADMGSRSWEESLELTRDTLDRLDEKQAGKPMAPGMRSVQLNLARSHLSVAEANVRWTMNEYGRSDAALLPLSLVNIAGLVVLSSRRGNGKASDQ